MFTPFKRENLKPKTNTSTMSDQKYVYTFGDGSAEGNASMKNLLGGKGANLAEMSSLGIPVPPGFTISTEACNDFYVQGKEVFIPRLKAQVEAGVSSIESIMHQGLENPANPCLLSVRSGARVSMPAGLEP